MKYYDSLPDKSTYESSVAESESIDAYNKDKAKADVDKSIEDYNESSLNNSSYQYSN